MKIQVLYVSDCPHLPAALSRLRAVLSSLGVTDPVEELEVRDAAQGHSLAFRGSPTVRINGRDVAGEDDSLPSPGLTCRLYPGSDLPGVPSLEMIRRAILTARRAGGS